LEWIAEGEAGLAALDALREELGSAAVLFLDGADLRGQDIRPLLRWRLRLDGTDLRGIVAAGAFLPPMERARLDGADLRGAHLSDLTECSLKEVDVTGGRFNPISLEGCDFTGAKLAGVNAAYSHAPGNRFCKADLTGIDFGESELAECDFTDADLSQADLTNCDLSGAVLHKARLGEADLTAANLSRADLRKADLRGTNLGGADLSGAKVGGADFTDANLTNAKLDGVVGKAKGLDPREAAGAGHVGEHVRRLEEAAWASKELYTSISGTLPGGGRVKLYLTHVNKKSWSGCGGRYRSEGVKNAIDSYIDGQTVSECMRNLATKWGQATLRPETVEVTHKKSTIKGEELRRLALAAWYEAYGRKPPPE
jgi:uncharacterized protein YjbI with pentapeptide repeats